MAFGDNDPAAEIARLEARIEALHVSLERCRKLSLAARALIAAGGCWLGLIVLGIVAFAPFGFIAAVAAALGGIVLLGSNASTWRQDELALTRAEALRAELIETMRLQLVTERSLLH